MLLHVLTTGIKRMRHYGILVPACKGQMLDAAHLCRTAGAQLQVGKLAKGHAADAWWCSVLWPRIAQGFGLSPLCTA